MEFYEAIRSRRSIRKYRPDMVSDQVIRKIVEAACWAPSSSNSQPWEFVVVRDRSMLERLSRTHVYAGLLRCSLVHSRMLRPEEVAESLGRGLLYSCGEYASGS